MLLTRTPLYSGLLPFTFDLHVLGTPPAFALSQDQTLMFNFLIKPGLSSRSFAEIQTAYYQTSFLILDSICSLMFVLTFITSKILIRGFRHHSFCSQLSPLQSELPAYSPPLSLQKIHSILSKIQTLRRDFVSVSRLSVGVGVLITKPPGMRNAFF